MNKFDQLETEISSQNICVAKIDLPENISGLYYEDGKDKLIALNPSLQTQAEQACVLAEELGHYYTSCGNILTDPSVDNATVRRQELRARRWAIKRLVSFRRIIRAYKAGCQYIYEYAEFMGVTEDFLRKSLEQYAEKHGACVRIGNYMIYFDPPAVSKLFG